MTIKPGLAPGFLREYGIIDLVTWAVPLASGQSRWHRSLEPFVRDLAPRVKAAA